MMNDGIGPLALLASFKAKAQPMVVDEQAQGWVPLKTHHMDAMSYITFETCPDDSYSILAQRIIDSETLLRCIITPDIEYHEASKFFHHWTMTAGRHGLMFTSLANAAKFELIVKAIVEKLSLKPESLGQSRADEDETGDAALSDDELSSADDSDDQVFDPSPAAPLERAHVGDEYQMAAPLLPPRRPTKPLSLAAPVTPRASLSTEEEREEGPPPETPPPRLPLRTLHTAATLNRVCLSGAPSYGNKIPPRRSASVSAPPSRPAPGVSRTAPGVSRTAGSVRTVIPQLPPRPPVVSAHRPGQLSATHAIITHRAAAPQTLKSAAVPQSLRSAVTHKAANTHKAATTHKATITHSNGGRPGFILASGTRNATLPPQSRPIQAAAVSYSTQYSDYREDAYQESLRPTASAASKATRLPKPGQEVDIVSISSSISKKDSLSSEEATPPQLPQTLIKLPTQTRRAPASGRSLLFYCCLRSRRARRSRSASALRAQQEPRLRDERPAGDEVREQCEVCDSWFYPRENVKGACSRRRGNGDRVVDGCTCTPLLNSCLSRHAADTNGRYSPAWTDEESSGQQSSSSASSSSSDGSESARRCRRRALFILLSIVLPCILCYKPCHSCHTCGKRKHLWGSKHIPVRVKEPS